MSLRVNIEGGTNAGVREPFQGNAEPWMCSCRIGVSKNLKLNPGYLAHCNTCGMHRP